MRTGNCYEYGRGVSADAKKAVEWYQRSADQGNAPAQYDLGTQKRWPLPPHACVSLLSSLPLLLPLPPFFPILSLCVPAPRTIFLH